MTSRPPTRQPMTCLLSLDRLIALSNLISLKARFANAPPFMYVSTALGVGFGFREHGSERAMRYSNSMPLLVSSALGKPSVPTGPSALFRASWTCRSTELRN